MSIELDICIPVKNRLGFWHQGQWRYLLPKTLESIRSVQAALPGVYIKTYISDFYSDDADVEALCQEILGSEVAFTIHKVNPPFSRGRGLKRAWSLGHAQYIFILDADMTFDESVILHALEHLKMDRAVFPICRRYTDFSHDHWVWGSRGFGMSFFPRKFVMEHGDMMPEYTQWGFEDLHFFHHVCARTCVVRYAEPGLYHSWHPNSEKWKNRFGAYPGMHHVLVRIRARMYRIYKRVVYGATPPPVGQLYEIDPATGQRFFHK